MYCKWSIFRIFLLKTDLMHFHFLVKLWIVSERGGRKDYLIWLLTCFSCTHNMIPYSLTYFVYACIDSVNDRMNNKIVNLRNLCWKDFVWVRSWVRECVWWYFDLLPHFKFLGRYAPAIFNLILQLVCPSVCLMLPLLPWH